MRYALIPLLFVAGCTQDGLSISSTEQPIAYSSTFHTNLAAGNNNDNTDCTDFYTVCQFVGHASGSVLTGIDVTAGIANHNAVYIRNVGTVPFTVAHNSSASSSANRFQLRGGRDVILAPGRWVVVGRVLNASFGAGPIEWMGDDSIYGVEDIATPSRSIGTAWQNTTSRPVMVTFSASASCDITLAGGEDGHLEFRSDTANPPTTVRARIAECGHTGTVVVGIAVANRSGGSMSYLMRPGDFGLIQSVTNTGTPTYTITAQTEQTL